MQNYNEKQLVDRSLLLKMYWDPVGLPTSTLPPPQPPSKQRVSKS